MSNEAAARMCTRLKRRNRLACGYYVPALDEGLVCVYVAYPMNMDSDRFLEKLDNLFLFPLETTLFLDHDLAIQTFC